MINGITTEFGQVLFDGARVAAENMIGAPGEGWRVAMTIVSHEREPGELGYVARYAKTVKELEQTVRADPGGFRSDQRDAVAWARVQVEMLRLHVSRRLSERLDGIEHGPGGSIDKLLMTWVEQTVGAAAVAVAAARWLNQTFFDDGAVHASFADRIARSGGEQCWRRRLPWESRWLVAARWSSSRDPVSPRGRSRSGTPLRVGRW